MVRPKWGHKGFQTKRTAWSVAGQEKQQGVREKYCWRCSKEAPRQGVGRNEVGALAGPGSEEKGKELQLSQFCILPEFVHTDLKAEFGPALEASLECSKQIWSSLESITELMYDSEQELASVQVN